MKRRAPIARRTPLKRGPAPKRKKRISRKPKRPRLKLKAECDRLFSRFIRLRDGGCRLAANPSAPVYYGCRGVLQCAHLFSRRYFGTRWDVLGAWALCAAHHVYYTHRPIEWDDLLREELGPEAYETLRRRALHEPMPDLEATRVRLNWLLREYER